MYRQGRTDQLVYLSTGQQSLTTDPRDGQINTMERYTMYKINQREERMLARGYFKAALTGDYSQVVKTVYDVCDETGILTTVDDKERAEEICKLMNDQD